MKRILLASMLGASLLLGGLRYHVQEYNRAGGRLYSALLLMATVALLAPSAVADLDLAHGEVLTQKLSTALAVLLIIAYGLGLVFSLGTHKELMQTCETYQEIVYSQLSREEVA